MRDVEHESSGALDLTVTTQKFLTQKTQTCKGTCDIKLIVTVLSFDVVGSSNKNM